MSEGGRPTLTLRGDGWRLLRPRAAVRVAWLFGAEAVIVLGATAPAWLGALGASVVFIVGPLGFWLMTRRCQLLVSEEGVVDRRLWRERHWTWDDAALVAMGPVYRSRWSDETGALYLMLCVRRDPYPHTLKGIAFGYGLEAAFVLDRIAAAGYPVDARTDASPVEWWVDDPRRTGS